MNAIEQCWRQTLTEIDQINVLREASGLVPIPPITMMFMVDWLTRANPPEDQPQSAARAWVEHCIAIGVVRRGLEI